MKSEWGTTGEEEDSVQVQHKLVGKGKNLLKVDKVLPRSDITSLLHKRSDRQPQAVDQV